MGKRTRPVASRGEHLANKKGKGRAGAPKGNKNPARGPRIGRATLAPPRTKRPDELKAQPRGKGFEPGSNSHTGEVFQRGRDRIPRGNQAHPGSLGGR